MVRHKAKSNVKKEAQKKHALRRAYERYGIVPKLSEIVAAIQQGRATFVERHSLRLTRWKVMVSHVEVIVIYDKQRKSIVTFLLPEEEYQKQP